jgi:hypothetical protein
LETAGDGSCNRAEECYSCAAVQGNPIAVNNNNNNNNNNNYYYYYYYYYY